jgi:hypothetical protein
VSTSHAWAAFIQADWAHPSGPNCAWLWANDISRVCRFASVLCSEVGLPLHVDNRGAPFNSPQSQARLSKTRPCLQSQARLACKYGGTPALLPHPHLHRPAQAGSYECF